MPNESKMEYQKAIDYIYQQVREGKLSVGSKLPSEREVAEELGIGRNSTREAMSILRGMGFVESVHGSGNYIAQNSQASIRRIVKALLTLGSVSLFDVLEFRKVLSQAVGYSIISNGFAEEDRRRIKEILDNMENSESEEFIKYDKEFHMELIRATKNPMFSMIMEPMAEVYLESVSNVISNVSNEVRIELYEVHKKIYECIVSRDTVECARYITRHYDIAERNM